jgi:AbiV family abortive infection protein
MSLPSSARLPIVQGGLAALAEHVARLRSSTERLINQGDARAARVVDATASEEAAKALVLLDLVRLGWKEDARARILIKYFYRHLQRGIYAEMVDMSPASYGEVRQIVDRLRLSHYLDGPNDVDWVFRNEVESAREEAIYVDYIETDEGPRWVSPAWRDDVTLWGPSRATTLVGSLDRAGLLTLDGLKLIASEWNGVVFVDDSHWQEVETRTWAVLQGAEVAGLFSPELTSRDTSLILESWGFPLHSLDLSLQRVTDEELRAEQREGMDRLAAEWHGL